MALVDRCDSCKAPDNNLVRWVENSQTDGDIKDLCWHCYKTRTQHMVRTDQMRNRFNKVKK